MTSTTRPAGIGGIDLAGIDIARAIFEATGGGVGTPRDTQPAANGTPSKLPDWVTNWGNGDLRLEIDFGKAPPADRDAPIKLVAEPEDSHPLFDLMQPAAEPVFPNGGPEGTGWVVVAAAVVVVGAAALAAAYLAGAFDNKPAPPDKPPIKENPDGGLPVWENQYRDPEAAAAPLTAPDAMLAALLGKSGVPVVEAGKIEIGDLLADLSDRMGKVAGLIQALTGAARAGDAGAAVGAATDLLALAGLDGFDFAAATSPAQDLAAGIFTAFGIAGGFEGALLARAASGTDDDSLMTAASSLAHLSARLADWIDDIA